MVSPLGAPTLRGPLSHNRGRTERASDPKPERAGYLASFIFVDEHQISVQLFGERQGLTFPCTQHLQPGGKGLLGRAHDTPDRQVLHPASHYGRRMRALEFTQHGTWDDDLSKESW